MTKRNFYLRECFEELSNGDCMQQKEFHRLYQKAPARFRAELVNGIVYVSEPVSEAHGYSHTRLSSIFDAYSASTPGTRVYDNSTVILSEEDEVQPDLFLRILPIYQGQTQDVTRGPQRLRYVKGAPELVAEIASSSRAIDLHVKQKRYQLAGVLEYIVICLEPLHIVWFNLSEGRLMECDTDGIFRSTVFPGLWIHRDGLLQMDYHFTMRTLNLGIASKEHQAFAKKLASTQD